MEKGGLAARLAETGLREGQRVAWADEMRLGLHGQVRRRWTLRGVKLRQAVEVQYVWRYLALAVEPVGRLTWRWLTHLRKEGMAETLRGWKEEGIQAVVWDGAPSHKAKAVRTVGLPLVGLPPYSPELNPAERVFEELRRSVEGVVYGTVEAKMAAVERTLNALVQDQEALKRLAGWSWIHQALQTLPPPNAAFG